MFVSPTGGLAPPAPCDAARKIPLVSTGHFTGHLVVGDDVGEGRVIEVESHLEMQAALILHARRDILDIETQVPFEWVTRTANSTAISSTSSCSVVTASASR